MSEITNKKGLFIIVILVVVLALLLSAGFIRDKQMQKANNEDYNKWLQVKNSTDTGDSKDNNKNDEQEDNNSSENDNDKETQKTDVYTKIKNKQNIKVLVLGDGLALSVGRNSQSGIWQDGFKDAIQSKLGVKADLVSLAQNKSSTKEGLQVASNANDLSDYDVVITCFGHNDNMSKLAISDFESNYNKIISKLKEANDKVTVIAILPNTLDKDNEYRNKIIQIAKKNDIKTSDMKSAFTSYGSSEKNLTKDSLPNDTGYQVYTKTLYDTFAQEIK